MSGMEHLTEFLTERYLEEYIPFGGSKIKFVTGRPQSGKTFFLKTIRQSADQRGYKTVFFSAKKVWMHDFKELYLEVLRQVDMEACLLGCAGEIVCQMGYKPEEIPEGMTFMDHLAEQGMGDAITRREIRLLLKQMFLDNPFLDNNFALVCSLITGGILGHPLLEEQNREILLKWLAGDKSVKLSLLRMLGLSPSRITKLNARHMLRSLAEVAHLGGNKGILVLVDDMEQLIVRSGLEEIHYTKQRREDTYESIRQLIDEIDSMRYLMFVFGFGRELIDNENYGLKAYQALWMRIQNEISGERFNCFQDILDLDQYARQEYTAEVLHQLFSRLYKRDLRSGEISLSAEKADELLEQAKTSGMGIVGLVKQEIARMQEEAVCADGEEA